MSYCSNCGEKLPKDAYFCPKCGTKTPSGKEANVSSTSEELRQAFNKMSVELEKAFNVAAKEIQEAFQKASANVQKSMEREAITCSSCGTTNAGNSVYCFSCGKQLEQKSEEKKA
jgi:uncharacterized membrane protein YvbJ